MPGIAICIVCTGPLSGKRTLCPACSRAIEIEAGVGAAGALHEELKPSLAPKRIYKPELAMAAKAGAHR